MNIDKKLELAHEYLLRWSGVTVKDAWQYADAMEVEYNKREKEQKDKIYDPMRAVRDAKDFQVDWSVAPDWAKYFAVDENTEGWFFIQEPTIDVDGCWYCVGGSCMAFSHDYQGDWKDSLRKRP